MVQIAQISLRETHYLFSVGDSSSINSKFWVSYWAGAALPQCDSVQPMGTNNFKVVNDDESESNDDRATRTLLEELSY